MDYCYENNTLCETGTPVHRYGHTPIHPFLDHVLNWAINCPMYIMALVVPLQLIAQLQFNSKRKQPLGTPGILHMVLTVCLISLMLWKISLDNDVELTAEDVSTRNLMGSYVIVLFLSLFERLRGSNSKITFLLFWISTAASLSINWYHDINVALLGKDTLTLFIDITHIVIVALQTCLLYLRKRDTDSEGRKHDVHLHPKEKASWLSDITFHWAMDINSIGSRRDLQESDVSDLPRQDLSRNVVVKLEKNLKIQELIKDLNNEELEREQQDDKITDETKVDSKKVEKARVSIAVVLIKTFGLKFFCLHIMKALGMLTMYVTPLFTGAFMNYVEYREQEHWLKGVIIVFSSFLMASATHIFHVRHWPTLLRHNKKMRSGIALAVFKKALTIRNEATKDLTTGEIVNLISEDCDKVGFLSRELFHIISTPLIIAVGMYLLFDLVGYSMFIGLALLILVIPMNRYVGQRIKQLSKEKDEAKDKRIKLMNEIINGIKVLKLYAWELSFMDKVQEIREKEKECNNSISFLEACIDSMFRAVPFLVKLGAFGVYILQGGHLDPTTGFTAMHLFHILNFPFGLMPIFIPIYVEGIAALNRIENFMNGDDIPSDNVITTQNANAAISITKGEFTWDTSRETNTLRNINVDVPKGNLIAVVGMVGTGKSSLLSAVLGEMEKLKGRVEVQGKVAYVPQEAWILNATFQENVLFGTPMDLERYSRVVEACALKHDMNMMEAGDKTEIGEKGINLSGGQKQRVSLARALYSDADIYLFDDPLSAVDAHVGKHIFNHVVSDKGILNGKTRVLVTHGLQWLPNVDSIIVMKDGEISESGTYEELTLHDGAFAQFLRNALANSKEKPDLKTRKSVEKTLSRIESRVHSIELPDIEDCSDDDSSGNASADEGVDETDYVKKIEESKGENNEKAGKLIDDEELEQGKVNSKVYLEYIKAIGFMTTLLLAALSLATSVFDTFNCYSLKQWTDDPILYNKSLADTPEYAGTKWNHYFLFGLTGAFEVIFGFSFVFGIQKATYQAATHLHNNLLYRVLRCPISFFDTTPSSRILMRFSKDVNRVDQLCGRLRGVIHHFFRALMNLLMVFVCCPAITYYVIPISIAHFFLFKFYTGSIEQLKRLKSKYTSPMYAHFTETIRGVSSVRSYGSEKRFIKKMENHIDECNKFDMTETWCSFALHIRLGLLPRLINLIVGLMCVADSSVTAGMAGLIILYAGDFNEDLNRLFWTLKTLESEMTSLEKLIEYSNKPSEAEWDITETTPESDWPSKGCVSFTSYKARYREGLDLVLKGVDCKIQSGEKVGIVGRTGAGKTSLTMAFFRLLEAADGDITIDDKNIADLGLHNLRSRINILPQEPVIFSGTLKMNLDPFGRHSDDDLWAALKTSHMENFVKGQPKQLEYECGEGGKNLSVGQRQLLCLARTLLRKTKILVLDEATAAVDMETDELIQKTIRSEFKECTVLTIAHRLNTILDYDKIMVLENGRVKEFDSPVSLMFDPKTTFHSMAKDAKLV